MSQSSKKGDTFQCSYGNLVFSSQNDKVKEEERSAKEIAQGKQRFKNHLKELQWGKGSGAKEKVPRSKDALEKRIKELEAKLQAQEKAVQPTGQVSESLSKLRKQKQVNALLRNDDGQKDFVPPRREVDKHALEKENCSDKINTSSSLCGEPKQHEASSQKAFENNNENSKLKRPHVFWANRSTRTNSCISANFNLALNTQSIHDLGKPPAELGLQEFVEKCHKSVSKGELLQRELGFKSQKAEASQEEVGDGKKTTQIRQPVRKLVQKELDFKIREAETSRCFENGKRVEPDNAEEAEHERLRTFSTRPFKGPAWRKLGLDYESRHTIHQILFENLADTKKVPHLNIIVSKVVFLEEGAMAFLSDPTGEIESEVHPLVLKKFEFIEGAAIHLANFTVFRSHLNREGYATHSIIITPRNIAAVITPNTAKDMITASSVPGSQRSENTINEMMEWMKRPGGGDTTRSELEDFFHSSDEESEAGEKATVQSSNSPPRSQSRLVQTTQDLAAVLDTKEQPRVSNKCTKEPAVDQDELHEFVDIDTAAKHTAPSFHNKNPPSKNISSEIATDLPPVASRGTTQDGIRDVESLPVEESRHEPTRITQELDELFGDSTLPNNVQDEPSSFQTLKHPPTQDLDSLFMDSQPITTTQTVHNSAKRGKQHNDDAWLEEDDGMDGIF